MAEDAESRFSSAALQTAFLCGRLAGCTEDFSVPVDIARDINLTYFVGGLTARVPLGRFRNGRRVRFAVSLTLGMTSTAPVVKNSGRFVGRCVRARLETENRFSKAPRRGCFAFLRALGNLRRALCRVFSLLHCDQLAAVESAPKLNSIGTAIFRNGWCNEPIICRKPSKSSDCGPSERARSGQG